MSYQEIINRPSIEKEGSPEISNQELLKTLKRKALIMENGNITGVFSNVRELMEYNKEQLEHRE